jgi:hypothetical protein
MVRNILDELFESGMRAETRIPLGKDDERGLNESERPSSSEERLIIAKQFQSLTLPGPQSERSDKRGSGPLAIPRAWIDHAKVKHVSNCRKADVRRRIPGLG